MKKQNLKLALLVMVIIAFSSCTTYNKTVKEQNTIVNFNKSDFSLSEQVSAEVKSVKIIGIDWSRLFVQKTGTIDNYSSSFNFSNIPIIGNFVSDKTVNYSLYELMLNNPGYDVIFYPQYEKKIVRPFIGIGLILKITTVKTTARLGKLNK